MSQVAPVRLLLRVLGLLVACAYGGVTLGAQAATPPASIGEPRWMPVDRIAGGRTADALAMEKGLLALIERIKAVAPLNPLPGVYPRATLTFTPGEPGQVHRGDLLLGFWPPPMVRVRNGRLDSSGELSHLIVYVNGVRTEAMDRTFWKDAAGPLMPEPRQLGQVQGFPVLEGFGGAETSGILVITPKGRSVFEPVSRERFQAFEIAELQKQIAQGMSTVKAAQEKGAALTSPEGRAARDARIATSLGQYEKARPRTPEQMTSRGQELRRLEAEEEARLQAEATPSTNRLVGPLTTRLTAATAALTALSPTDRAQQACHLPDARVQGPHPVAPGTTGCQPVVAPTSWSAASAARGDWRVLSIERYWPSAEDVRRGVDRTRTPWAYVNAAVVEAVDWQTVAATLLK